MSAACHEVKQLSTWNHHKISPTFLSENVITPLQLPIRDTVPRSYITSEGTSRRFPQLDWGSFDYDNREQRKLSFLGRDSKKLPELIFPRTHRHYLSSCGKMLNGVVQPRKITSLLRSNLRQSDEFILPPHRCTNLAMMKEENHFIQEPYNFVTMSRNELFPKSRGEYDTPCLPHEFRQRTPLSEMTKQGLNGVAHRRYKVSSYFNDYKTPHSKDQDSENSLNIGRRKKVEETQRYPLENQEKHAVKGLWPSWPAGNNYIVSNVTGQIVEKRDVRSLDDLRDYRKHKKFCNYSTPRGDKKVLPAESKFLSYASSEYAPLQDIDMYGCDLEKIGDGNTDREIPVGTTQYNSLNYRQLKRLLRPRKVWCEEDTMTQPSNKNIETNNQKAPPMQTRQVTENMKGCSYRNHLKKLQDYREQENLEFAMRQRWVADKRLGCLSEHVIELDSDTSPPHPSPSKSCSSDLSVEEVEDDTEKDQHQRKVQFGDVNIALYPKEKPEVNEKPQYHFRTPYYSTRTNYAADGEIENPVVTSDFRSVSLELARSTETVSGFLKSMSSAEEAKKRAFEKAKEERLKFADLQKQGSKEHEERCTLLDSTCTLYKPNIKLPPHKLWTSLQYNGNRVPDRLGVRFKTIASKRYHAVHPEMIPDPRDFRPPLRKNKFLGYHTSVFR